MKRDPLAELRLRMRAEEMRAVAGIMTVEENRKFYNSIAADYEQLASAAGLIAGPSERLLRISERLAASSLEGQSEKLSTSAINQWRDRIQTYREMAADAAVLAKGADEQLREKWSQLSRHWSDLADNLEVLLHEQQSPSDHE